MKGGTTAINHQPLAAVWQMILDTLSLVPVDAEFTPREFFNGWFADRYPEYCCPWGVYQPLLEVLARPGGPLERRRKGPGNPMGWHYSLRTKWPTSEEWAECTVARCPYQQFMKQMKKGSANAAM